MSVKPILNKEELDRLAEVIGEAEKETSGEIRLMIVRRSTPAGHTLAALWLVLVCLSLMVLWYQRESLWDAPAWLVPVLLLACGVVAFPLARLSRVQRLFLTPQDMHHAVWARAELEFHREGLSHTQGATGILLFLSLFERQAVVLADRGINSRLDGATWTGVIKTLLQGEGKVSWAANLEAAIRQCGKLLAAHCPAQPGDSNELPNAVILKD